MYERIYSKADELANAIRNGTYTPKGKLEGTRVTGLMSRKQPTAEVQQTSADGIDEDFMMDYFVKIREENEKLMEAMSNMRGNPTGFTPSVNSKRGGELTDVERAKAAIAKNETGGHKNPYVAKGPVVQKGSYAGDRAYGKYQVMGKNIPSWTQEALGRSLTVSEFLANPDAQEAVATYRLSKYHKQYGSWEDAASVWFSGRPVGVGDMSQTDGYTSRATYVDKFRSNL